MQAQPTPAAGASTGQDPERRGIPWSTLLWTAVLVLLGVALVLRLLGGDDPGAPLEVSEEEARGPGWDVDRPTGETVRLLEGALARVNAVTPGVTLDPGLPAPAAGTRLDRADVEICAGEQDRFVDPAFWLALGEDNAVHSAHMGVRDFLTMTLAPGTCQRGFVDLALPEGVGTQAVLLVDHTRTTVAAWAVAGEPGVVTPLEPTVTPEVAGVGATHELETSGSVTLHTVDVVRDTGEARLELDAEVCAADQPLITGAGNWFVQLPDHRLLPARRDASTTPGELQPGDCASQAAGFALPEGAEPAAVVYTYGGVYEEARWRVPD